MTLHLKGEEQYGIFVEFLWPNTKLNTACIPMIKTILLLLKNILDAERMLHRCRLYCKCVLSHNYIKNEYNQAGRVDIAWACTVTELEGRVRIKVCPYLPRCGDMLIPFPYNW